MKRFFVTIVLSLICLFSKGQYTPGRFKIVQHDEKKQIDILFNGKLLTAYCYFDSIKKPFLFPVNTIDGITVTRDRKSTRLNSSHSQISYAVFCLKKKKPPATKTPSRP